MAQTAQRFFGGGGETSAIAGGVYWAARSGIGPSFTSVVTDGREAFQVDIFSYFASPHCSSIQA